MPSAFAAQTHIFYISLIETLSPGIGRKARQNMAWRCYRGGGKDGAGANIGDACAQSMAVAVAATRRRFAGRAKTCLSESFRLARHRRVQTAHRRSRATKAGRLMAHLAFNHKPGAGYQLPSKRLYASAAQYAHRA
jgi:hypothetical protein